MKIAWWQIDLTLVQRQPPETAELLSQTLLDMGSAGVQEISRRRRLWRLRGYVSTKTRKAVLQKRLRQVLQAGAIQSADVKVGIRLFRDLSWQTRWKKYAKPISLHEGRRHLHIIPTHLPREAKDLIKRFAGPIIWMDAGMAFGTGSHPTTYLALKALFGEIMRKRPVSLLDVGTGSGILALAAARLGVEHIDAIDNDPEATHVAGENLIKNNLGPSDIHLQTGELKRAPAFYELIVANITLHPLLELLPDLAASLPRGGRLILSGILTTQATEMMRALPTQQLQLRQRKNYRGWSSLLAEKI